MPELVKAVEALKAQKEARGRAEKEELEKEERRKAKANKIDALLQHHAAADIDDEQLDTELQALEDEYGADEFVATVSDGEEELEPIPKESEKCLDSPMP